MTTVTTVTTAHQPLAPEGSDGVPTTSPPSPDQRRAAHEARVDALVGDHLARRARGERHPVEDFLFTYYSLRPGQLRQFHPGVPDLDLPAFLARRADDVRHLRDLLVATASRPARMTCFGLHEWAMVYRQSASDQRHLVPLRLGGPGTDTVVENHRIRCSHYDAFRFFTADARPRNEFQPTRADQVGLEQPGCLHATMDLYKWAYKLTPATPSELVVDCFELARDARVLDMRASPYDLRSLGYEPIPIETAEGKAAYLTAQRELIRRAEPLRAKLIALCDLMLDSAVGQRR